MSHEELIAVLDDLDIALSNGFGKASTFIACTKAVRKVIELHTPGVGQPYCSRCDVAYPCATIYAIEKELNHG
jgi:hypothetical protein